MGKLSIDQVAELAFVSRSVVSRVLNNHSSVSDEAKERVLKVIKKHNYHPSPVARGLATNKKYEIGILAPRRCNEALGNGFWSLLHLGIFEECIRKGYIVTMSPISTDMGEDINEYILDAKRLDGYILLTHEVIDFVISDISELAIPTVMVGNYEKNQDISSIDVNNYSGVYKSTNHLIELGHQHIGAIMASPEMKESAERIDGFKQALGNAGLNIPDNYIAINDYSQKHGYETMKRWIRQGLNISAVVCMSDTLAMGAILALNEENISVPEQFSVVGFDDLPFAQYMVPPLTTVKQPIYKKGKRAASLLVEQIENKSDKAVHETLEPNLIIRESTAAFKISKI